MSHQRFLVSCLMVMGMLLPLGCGKSKKRYAVSGTVTFKGEPVKLGTINFASEDASVVGGATITDGKFEMSEQNGLPVGKYRVAITYPDPKIPAPRPDEPPGESAPIREILPAKYNDETELTAEIKPQKNELNFPLVP